MIIDMLLILHSAFVVWSVKFVKRLFHLLSFFASITWIVFSLSIFQLLAPSHFASQSSLHLSSYLPFSSGHSTFLSNLPLSLCLFLHLSGLSSFSVCSFITILISRTEMNGWTHLTLLAFSRKAQDCIYSYSFAPTRSFTLPLYQLYTKQQCFWMYDGSRKHGKMNLASLTGETQDRKNWDRKRDWDKSRNRRMMAGRCYLESL